MQQQSWQVNPATTAQGPVFDVTDAEFATAVLERSHQVPVVVDFWAAWCGPCRTLGPMIEAAVHERNGAVVLAKLDVDRNPQSAQQFRVQGIPQVIAFSNGEVVDQFTGVVPPQQLAAFLDGLAPDPVELALVDADQMPPDQRREALEAIVRQAPDHKAAALQLAGELVEDSPQRAVELATPHRPDPAAESVIARASIAQASDEDVQALQAQVAAGDMSATPDLARGLAAQGRYDEAITVLLAAIQAGGDNQQPARQALLDLFAALGDDDPRVGPARRKLAAALF